MLEARSCVQRLLTTVYTAMANKGQIVLYAQIAASRQAADRHTMELAVRSCECVELLPNDPLALQSNVQPRDRGGSLVLHDLKQHAAVSSMDSKAAESMCLVLAH